MNWGDKLTDHWLFFQSFYESSQQIIRTEPMNTNDRLYESLIKLVTKNPYDKCMKN